VDVSALTAFLAPFLPVLLGAARTAADEAGRSLGSEALEHARRLWGRLRPRVEQEPEVQAAAAKVADDPDDDRLRRILALHLEGLVATDADLAAELERLWAEARRANVVTVRGDRNVVVGRDVTGVIVTGDDAHLT
jgi:hypothetical protein